MWSTIDTTLNCDFGPLSDNGRRGLIVLRINAGSFEQ